MSGSIGLLTPSVEHKAQCQQPRVVKIALCGGPCGGKTTAASVITDRLQVLGWRVFRVPEAATLMLSGGFTFKGITSEQVYNFQLNLLKLMMHLEDAFMDVAQNCGQRAIVLCDRGSMDASAYMDEPQWQALLDELGYTVVGLRDSRYNCVIHLISAAEGASKFYNTDTNVVRMESVDEAKSLDLRIMNAWVGHPYLHIVDNSTDFTSKITRILDIVLQHLGEQSIGVRKRKFLIQAIPTEFPVISELYRVEHVCLLALDGTQPRIRKRGQNGRYTYTHTIRYPNTFGERLELRRVLSGREFLNLKRQIDPNRFVVKKTRRSFHYQNQYYELDCFEDLMFNGKSLMMLEAYIADGHDVILPDWLEVEREVTGQSEFSLYQLSLKPLEARRSIDGIIS